MFKDVFNEIIKQKNLSLYKVAKDTNIPKTIVYDWAAGVREPVSEYVVVLADYLECSVDVLLGRGGKNKNVSLLKVASPDIKSPLFSKKSLIADSVYEKPLDLTAHLSTEDILSSNDDFIIIMQDNSMAKECIFDGTEVLIRRGVMPQNGDVAAVKADGSIILRKLFIEDEKVILECANDGYLPVEYKVDEIEILGRAVEIRTKI